MYYSCVPLWGGAVKRAWSAYYTHTQAARTNITIPLHFAPRALVQTCEKYPHSHARRVRADISVNKYTHKYNTCVCVRYLAQNRTRAHGVSLRVGGGGLKSQMYNSHLMRSARN